VLSVTDDGSLDVRCVGVCLWKARRLDRVTEVDGLVHLEDRNVAVAPEDLRGAVVVFVKVSLDYRTSDPTGLIAVSEVEASRLSVEGRDVIIDAVSGCRATVSVVTIKLKGSSLTGQQVSIRDERRTADEAVVIMKERYIPGPLTSIGIDCARTAYQGSQSDFSLTALVTTDTQSE
jgi:hypothetical protein